MDTLFIVITTRHYEIWKEAQSEGWVHKEFDNFEVRTTETNSNKKVVVVPQYQSNKQGREWEQETQRETTQRIKRILQHSQAEELRILAHANTLDWKEIDSSIDGTIPETEFRHVEGNNTYETAKKLVKKASSLSEKEIVGLEKSIQNKHTKNIAQKLRVLKHKLSHIFLPLEVDLQGWKETGFDDAYGQELKSVYKIKAHNGQEKTLLEQARNILYDREGQERDTDTVEALVEEAGMTSSSQWTTVRRLLPKAGREGGESFKAAQAIISSLESGKIKRAKRKVEDEDFFKEWFDDINCLLDEICESMEK